MWSCGSRHTAEPARVSAGFNLALGESPSLAIAELLAEARRREPVVLGRDGSGTGHEGKGESDNVELHVDIDVDFWTRKKTKWSSGLETVVLIPVALGIAGAARIARLSSRRR